MTLRPWRRNIQCSHNSFSVRFLDCVLRVGANWKNRGLGWLEFSITNLKQNVARTQTCCMRRTTLVNVLEHPTLLAIEIAAHECGGNGMASRNIRTLGVAKPRVTGLQFAQQVLYLLFELFVTRSSEDL